MNFEMSLSDVKCIESEYLEVATEFVKSKYVSDSQYYQAKVVLLSIKSGASPYKTISLPLNF